MMRSCLKLSLVTFSLLMLWSQTYTLFLFVSSTDVKSKTGYKLEKKSRSLSETYSIHNNITNSMFTPSKEEEESDRILLQKLKYMYEVAIHTRRKRLEIEDLKRIELDKFYHKESDERQRDAKMVNMRTKIQRTFDHSDSKLLHRNLTKKYIDKDYKPEEKHKKSDGKLDLSKYPLNVDFENLLKHRTDISNVVEQINRYLGTYIHAPWKRCSNLKQSPFLVLMIRSYSANFSRRKMIRKTWANESVTDELLFKRIFFFGDPNNKNVQKAIDAEQNEHRDILEVNLDDKLSTVKTLRALHWSVSYCSGSNYYMIVNDNMFVATDRLLQTLKSLSKGETIHYMGSVLRDMSPNRDEHSEWYISLDNYPFAKYPDFVYGGAMILSSNFSKDVLFAAKYIQFVKFEDVYIGIIAHKLGVQPQIIENFEIDVRINFHDPKFKQVLVSSGYGNEHRLRSAWTVHWNSVITKKSKPNS